MRVLLVYPNARKELIGYGDLGAIAEPLALEYLGAGVKLDGHEVQILDLRLHPDDLEETVRAYAPDLVGVTGYSMHVLRALKICAQVKAIDPGIRTIVGGHHATLLPEDFFAAEVDYVASGEGVKALREVLGALEGGDRVAGIAGVWSRVDGEFRSGGPQERFSFEDLPTPDRSLTAADRGSYFIDWMRPIALVRTTVGCPYRCSFCSLWKIMDGRYYMREVEKVAAELAGLDEDNVFLVDDEAFINGKRMKLLAEVIKSAGVEKRYFAYCRIDTLLRQPELMAQWREIGLARLFIGIEAVSKKSLVEYNKRVQVAQIEEGLKAARKLGIEVFGGFVVNTNFSRREFKQLERFIRHNKIDYPSFTILTPLPGTALLNNFDRVTERQPNGRPNWSLFDLQHPVTRTDLPVADFMRHYKALYRVFSEKYSVHRSRVRLRDGSGAVVVDL